MGEIEAEHGGYLLMLFRWLEIPMPLETDAAAIERAGVLLTRAYPWLAALTQKTPPRWAPRPNSDNEPK